MKIIFSAITMIAVTFVYSETLFEVKDASNRTVLDVSTDGLRVLNEGDTMMVISPGGVNFNIRENKGLSRTFSVTTASSKGKGRINALEVGTQSTTMREGVLGDEYSDFSPLNIFMGLNAGSSVGPGKYNVMIGNYAGNGTVGVVENEWTYYGWSNTFLGTNSGRYATNSTHNTYIGYSSGANSANGGDNTYIGTSSGQNQNGSCNTFVGASSGGNGTGTGSYNTCMGYLSGAYTTTGSSNLMLGDRAGYKIKTGSNNVSLGYRAGYNNEAGAGNVLIGYEAGFNELGSNKLYIDNSNVATPLVYGDFSADALTVNGTFSANGTYMKMVTNPGTGTIPTNYFYQGSTGSTAKQYAFSIYDALWVTGNTFFDANATVGGIIDINSTTNEALKVDGLEAIWLGQNASLQNYFSWGYGALYNYFADRITIGNAGYNSSYMLYVNGSAYATVNWASSDKRFKKDVTGIDNALDKISSIDGVKYSWRQDEFPDKGFSEGQHYGVIAQDLEKVIPEAVSTDSEGYKAVSYNDLVPILIEAIKELKSENESLKNRLENIEFRLKQ